LRRACLLLAQSGHCRPNLIGFEKLASSLTSQREDYVRRRDFIKGVAGSTVLWPLAAHAQADKMPVVGFINAAAAQNYKREVAAFLNGLRWLR
jgi:hypothetical protein